MGQRLKKIVVMLGMLMMALTLIACSEVHPVAVELVARITINGNLPADNPNFSLVLEPVSQVFLEDADEADAAVIPLPEDLQVEVTDFARATFGEILFEQAGTFVYRLAQAELATDTLILDTRKFYVTVVVTLDDGKLVAQTHYLVDDVPVDEIVFANLVFEPPYVGASGIPENYATTISDEEALSYLTLVNRHFRLTSDFTPPDLSVVSAFNVYEDINLWISMRATAARAMEAMLESAYEAGHTLILISGYRSYENQTGIHNNAIASFGEEQARRSSARPGHSEHQLGLAMDLSTLELGAHLSADFALTPEGIWIREHAHLFGFIIRYPYNREADTGFMYEPWHLRYVGIEPATQIFENDWILEEFLLRYPPNN